MFFPPADHLNLKCSYTGCILVNPFKLCEDYQFIPEGSEECIELECSVNKRSEYGRTEIGWCSCLFHRLPLGIQRHSCVCKRGLQQLLPISIILHKLTRANSRRQQFLANRVLCVRLRLNRVNVRQLTTEYAPSFRARQTAVPFWSCYNPKASLLVSIGFVVYIC